MSSPATSEPGDGSSRAGSGSASGAGAGANLCPHCGTRNPPGSNFCNRCGATLGADSAPPRDPAEPLGSSEAVDASLGEHPSAGAGREPSLPDATGRGERSDARGDTAGSTASSTAGASGDDAGGFDAVDEPTLEEMIAAYQPPEAGRAHAPAEPVSFPDEQLLGGGLGYLELVAVSGEMAAPKAEMMPAGGAESEHWRTVRALLRDEPVLASAGSSPTMRISYRPLWIVLLVLAAALAGMVLPPFFWVGAPVIPPGAAGAYDVVRNLVVDDEVLVIWMVDPATSGEVDGIALPVISHLLERGAQSVVVATRPAGLATARRSYANAVQGLDESAMRSVVDNWIGPGIYLPGSLTTLAMVANQPARALNFEPIQPLNVRAVLVVAANPNDAQEWIEAGWSRLRLPTVVISPATGDPMLRPYLQREQLDGLVAGFDGAAAYQALRDTPLSRSAGRQQEQLANAQNWGALALLVVLIAGNLVSLLGRSRGV